jgi:hypothetical protein
MTSAVRILHQPVTRSRIERNVIRVRSSGFYAAPGFRCAQPRLRRHKMKEADRRQAHCSRSDCSWRTRTQRRTGRAAEKAACAALPLRARSPAGVPPRLFPRGVWSLGAIRARLRGSFANAADMTAGLAPTSSGAPRTPVIVPAGMMPGPPGSRLMRPARGLRTRPHPPGITRTASFTGRDSSHYVSISETDVNRLVTWNSHAAYFCNPMPSQFQGTGPRQVPLPSGGRRGEKRQETSL